MSFNVRNLNKNEQMPVDNIDKAIMNFIKGESPDILVAQEGHYAMRRTTELDEIFPYKFVDFEYGVPRTQVINALYSRHPILNVQIIDFPKSDNAALFADIIVEQDTIRFYNVHLQSFRVVPDVAHLQDEASGKLFKRMVRVLKMQEEQTSVMNAHIKSSPYPVVLGGDFNNTQFSKSYRLLRGNLQDSFEEAGLGFGRTFEVFDLPLRIDYIFADENFEILSHTNYDVELSDHFPIMAQLRLRPNE